MGFGAIYMSGYGTSLSLTGLPDAGLVTMTEMIANARYIAQAVNIPVIADADNGYGNAINVIRTVREYIGAGVAGIHIEDQVIPKRCGHVAGREVIPQDEAVGKIRAAVAARDEADRDFVLIARTDARGAHGGSLDEAIRRANAYLEAGADMAFVEGPTSVAEVRRICAEVTGGVFYNMTGVSPRASAWRRCRRWESPLPSPPARWMRTALAAMHDLAVQLRDEGPMAEARFMEKFGKHPLGDLHTFAGFDRIRAWSSNSRRKLAAGPRAGRPDRRRRAGSAPPAGGPGRAPDQVAGVLLLVGRPVGSPPRRAVRRSLSSRRARRVRGPELRSAISAAARDTGPPRSRRSSRASSRSTPRRRCCRRRGSASTTSTTSICAAASSRRCPSTMRGSTRRR